MTIFMLGIIIIQLAFVLSLLNTIKKQNYIKLQIAVEENGWTEDKCNKIAEKALN